jgi:hypothetical protein
LKLHAVVCQVIARECFHAAAHSPHAVSLTVMPSGLHRVPDELRAELQSQIDKASGAGNDFIILGYGLCSRGTADLVARDTPIVIPRMHDCITLLLGSKERYQSEFIEHPGTYYFSSGWIEHMDGEMDQSGFQSLNERAREEKLREYTEKYGQDNAEYLLEQESGWLAHYSRAVLIETPFGAVESYRSFTREIAETRGWTYEELAGDMSLADKLFSGEWNSDEFLVVQPGQRTREAVNQGIISITDR